MTAVVSTLSADKRLAESGLEIPLRFIRPCLKNYPDWRVDIEGHIDSLPIGEKLRQRSLPVTVVVIGHAATMISTCF